jgi:antitoxin component of MazEF toxin-antitoxin module
MKTEFLKWGNSLALRVPTAFAKEVGASAGKTADMTIENGALHIKVEGSRISPVRSTSCHGDVESLAEGLEGGLDLIQP